MAVDLTCYEVNVLELDEECQLAWAIAESFDCVAGASDGGAGDSDITCSVFGCENTNFVHPGCMHPICVDCLTQLRACAGSQTVTCPKCRSVMVFSPAASPSTGCKRRRVAQKKSKNVVHVRSYVVRAHTRAAPKRKHVVKKE